MGRLIELMEKNSNNGTLLNFTPQENSFHLKLIKKTFYLFCRLFFKLYCPIKVKGTHYFPASSFILCSNHCSHMDSVVLVQASGLPPSSFGMVAAKDYFFDQTRYKIFNKFLNLIPMSRKCTKSLLLENLSICKYFINQGNRYLIIYPEGTRSLNGLMGSFKRGIAMIAIELGIPIVPVYIQGTYHAMPKGSYFPKPGTIHVVVGKPIYPAQYQSLLKTENRYSIYRQLADNLEKTILMLKEEHNETT